MRLTEIPLLVQKVSPPVIGLVVADLTHAQIFIKVEAIRRATQIRVHLPWRIKVNIRCAGEETLNRVLDKIIHVGSLQPELRERAPQRSLDLGEVLVNPFGPRLGHRSPSIRSYI